MGKPRHMATVLQSWRSSWDINGAASYKVPVEVQLIGTLNIHGLLRFNWDTYFISTFLPG